MFSAIVFGQDLELQTVSDQACNCLSDVPTTLEDEDKLGAIEECINTAAIDYQVQNSFGGLMETVMDTLKKIDPSKINDTITLDNGKNIVINPDKNYGAIEKLLLEDCPRMRLLLISKDETRENSVSDKKKARKLYDKGQNLFAQEEFRKAIVQYEKAVSKDKDFAFAYDMLGYSHRKLNEFDKAIEYYNKSLKIDPKGKMPLGNIPIAFEYSERYEEAIEAYAVYAEVYPDDPESFYGRGRLYHLLGDYENALESTMKAYLLYKEMNSPFLNDAQHNISLYYNELKEKDQLELFDRIAKKYDIQIVE